MGMSPPVCIPNAIIANMNRTITRFLLHPTKGMTAKHAADPIVAVIKNQFCLTIHKLSVVFNHCILMFTNCFKNFAN